MDDKAQEVEIKQTEGERKPGRSILIVEDDDLLRNTMTRYLKRIGYEVQSVANGFEALLLLQYRQPDLIITDIRMPKLGGLSMAEGLKNRQETKEIPLILVTGYRDETYFNRAQKLGAHFLLLKPFTLSDLHEKVETVFKNVKKDKPLDDNK